MRLRPEIDYSKEILKTYNKAWSEMIVVSKRDPSRLKSLRCSSLPFCPHAFFVEVARSLRHNHLDMAGLYYTSVGTTVHEVMQTALPQYSKNIVGNWLCRECGNLEFFKSQPQCCDFSMEYVEIDINYKGVVGHVDCLFKVPGGYYVVDFKTCSLNNSKEKEKDPGDAYKEQLLAYAYLLRKQYKLEIKGIMNLFIPRDNPAKAVAWSQRIGKHDLLNIKEKLKRYKAAHKTALSVNSVKAAMKMWDTFGNCGNRNCKACTSHDPKALLRQAVKQCKTLPIKDSI